MHPHREKHVLAVLQSLESITCHPFSLSPLSPQWGIGPPSPLHMYVFIMMSNLTHLTLLSLACRTCICDLIVQDYDEDFEDDVEDQDDETGVDIQVSTTKKPL